MVTGHYYQVNVVCNCDTAGGRGGSTYGQSKALGDVWRFTVSSRSWTQLTTSGRAPLPRFLFSSDMMYPMLHHSSTYKQAARSSTNANTHEQHVKTSSNTSLHLNAASSELHTAPDEVAPHSLERENADAQYDITAARSLGNATFRKKETGHTEMDGTTAGMQPADTRSATVGQNDRSAGSMIVFGGESIKGCYLDDVWVLHLNSLMWHELSRPVACQKRCRSMLEQN